MGGLKTISVASELRAIRSICDGERDVHSRLLAVLRSQHFASPPGSHLFSRITSLLRNGKTVPRIAVLSQDTVIGDDARDALLASEDQCLDEDDAASLADQLEQFRKLRVIYHGSTDVLSNLRDSNADGITAALDALERIIVQARSNYDETDFVISGSGSNAERVVNQVLSMDAPDRIKTGFSEFDAATGGFARKDLVLIASNTGGGKSVMAEQLAINAYVNTGQNRSVALVSYEMDEEEIYARLLSNLSDVPFEDIYLRKWIGDLTVVGANRNEKAIASAEEKRDRCRSKWEEFNRHGELEGNKFMVWCPTVDVTPGQIGAILSPLGYDLVIIDYVGLVTAEKEAALWENLGEITKGFKGVARRNDCVVAIMAQLDEESKKVKYSKAMRHHSSYVWLWTYGEEEEASGEVTIIQDKTRHCKKFPFDLIANFSTMRFTDAKNLPQEQPIPSSASLPSSGGAAAATEEDGAPSVDDLVAKGEQRRIQKSEEASRKEAERVACQLKQDRLERRLYNVSYHTDEDDE